MGDPFISTYQFENIFSKRKINLEDTPGMPNEENEIDQIKFTIEKIIDLSKPKE